METTYLANQVYAQQSGDLVLDEDRRYALRLRDLPVDEKPREKLIKFGPQALSIAELLAVLLNVGTKKEEILTMSRRLLKEYGDSAIIHQKDPMKVKELLGIPLVKSCQLVACFELGRRFFRNPASGKPVVLRTASQVYEYLKDMRDLSKEHLRGLYLDNHYRLIHDEIISIGSLTSNVIHPREVFRPALEYAASAVILAHNHPSGVAKASEADIAVTQQIVEAGRILGIGLLDHVIITKTKYGSIPVDYS
ncbi:MAG TPA: DNA repair protein RadC [Candidatus Paceibacterota bacterium]|nr:DNA repair protein RadC [Candidatus Paceibacterota bacterium]